MVLMVIGCGPVRRPPTYVAEMGFAIKQPAPSVQVGADARAVWKAARTVAFSPPKTCAKTQCAGFVARLEQAAMAAGLRVVSWQQLRGHKRSIDYARQHSVDVLFELNQLRFGVPARRLVRRVDAKFFNAASGDAVALGDPTAVARRCIPGMEPALRSDLAIELDLKMSSVRDGRVLWTYRSTRSPLPVRRMVKVRSRYKATSSYRLRNQTQWKIGLGIPSVVLAGLAALTTTMLDGLSGDDMNFPPALYVAEALVLASGIYMLATAKAKAHWGYSTPEQTLCVPGRLVGPRSVTLESTAPAKACDSSCRQQRRLVDRVIAELFARLNALRR